MTPPAITKDPVVTTTRALTITNEQGLHARPAARFVEVARQFGSDIQVRTASGAASCKSLISLLALGVTKGTDLEIEATGDDAEAAVDRLVELLGEFEHEDAVEGAP